MRYHIEVTDTFGGEANYCWRKQWLVTASSARGAITKLAKAEGSGWRMAWDCGDTVRYDLKGSCICAFVMWIDDSMVSSFNGVSTL
jgi:hypothetical protein